MKVHQVTNYQQAFLDAVKVAHSPLSNKRVVFGNWCRRSGKTTALAKATAEIICTDEAANVVVYVFNSKRGEYFVSLVEAELLSQEGEGKQDMSALERVTVAFEGQEKGREAPAANVFVVDDIGEDFARLVIDPLAELEGATVIILGTTGGPHGWLRRAAKSGFVKEHAVVNSVISAKDQEFLEKAWWLGASSAAIEEEASVAPVPVKLAC